MKIYSMLRRKVINLVSNVSNFPMCHSHINGLLPWADSEGGTGGPDLPPLKNHKYIGFLNNICSNTLKNHKATKPAFNVGPSSAPQQNAIAGRPMMARL